MAWEINKFYSGRSKIGKTVSSIYVGNLPAKHKPSELEDLLFEYGKCMIKDKGTFAFVDFSDKKIAEKVVD